MELREQLGVVLGALAQRGAVIGQLRAELAVAAAEIVELRRQLAQNSRNSSKLPSSDGVPEKQTQPGGATDRSRGRHVGSPRRPATARQNAPGHAAVFVASAVLSPLVRSDDISSRRSGKSGGPGSLRGADRGGNS